LGLFFFFATEEKEHHRGIREKLEMGEVSIDGIAISIQRSAVSFQLKRF